MDDKKTLLISTLTFLTKERNKLTFQAKALKLNRLKITRALKEQESQLMSKASEIDIRIRAEVDANLELLQDGPDN